MANIRERLANHKIIGLDTAVFIYHFEAHPTYLGLTTAVLNNIQSGAQRGIISTVLLMELTVHPWRNKQPNAARQYETLLVNFPNLRMADVTRETARKAAQLRAEYNLRPADALHVATALINGATAFVSNDRQLVRLEPMIEPFVLDDFV
jgi:predicted nucleic acid-binding protein